MSEMDHVFETIEKARQKGEPVAVATVVQVNGSAYRREGAKLAVDASGNVHGTISGGCLEPDVAEVAKEVLRSGQPALRHYDLDEDTVFSLGLGCSGTVDVYIEPVVSQTPEDSQDA